MGTGDASSRSRQAAGRESVPRAGRVSTAVRLQPPELEEREMSRIPRSLVLTFAAPAMMALAAACAKSDGSGDNAGADTTNTTAVSPPPPAPTAAPGTPAGVQPGALTDPQIAAIVLAANSADSAGGEQAREKATNPKVKEFAQRMVTDHGGVNKQAVALAGKLNVTPEENNTSRQLAQGGEQTRQQLNSLAPTAYDRAYIDHEVEYH